MENRRMKPRNWLIRLPSNWRYSLFNAIKNIMTDVSKKAIVTALKFFPFTRITYSWNRKNTKVAICLLFH